MKKMLNELVRYGKFAFALAFALCCFNASAATVTRSGSVDSWNNFLNSVNDGDIIQLTGNVTGDGASGTFNKSVTLDLNGYTISTSASSGWWTACLVTVIDSSTGKTGKFQVGANSSGCSFDFRALSSSQIDTKVNANTGCVLVWFPDGMTLSGCIDKINNPANNSHIVLEGQTYVLNGTDWTLEGALTPMEYATPTRTRIQSAIDNAGWAGIVELGEGTFQIDTRITLNRGVTLKGQGWGKTIIKQTVTSAQKNGGCVTIDNGARLEGVTLTGGKDSSDAGAGVWVKNGTVSWCCISNNTVSAGTTAGAGVSFSGGKGSIDHSVVVNNTMAASSWGAGIGANGLAAGGSVLIDTCLIYCNTNNSGTAGGIAMRAVGSDCIVRNCTIVGNKANSNVGGVYRGDGGTGKLTLVNNIISGNYVGSSEINAWEQSAGIFDDVNSKNCLISGSDTKDVSARQQIVSVLSSDPGFVNAAANDYRLGLISAAKGAGADGSGSGVDLANKAFAAAPSIGCYEYDSDAALQLGWTAAPMSASGDTICNVGDFVYGYAQKPYGNSTYTVHGVTFTALGDGNDFRNETTNPDISVSSANNFDWTNALGDEGVTGDYGEMLKCAFWDKDHRGDYTFTLKNLEAGKKYLVQVFAHRSGQSYHVTSPDSKVINVGGSGWTYGGSLVGVFTADETGKYTFTLNYDKVFVMNAIQVRKLTDTPPPSPPSAEWDTDCGTFAKRIAFTASGYEGSDALANFPVLVRLSTAISGFNYTDCGTNGANIRFVGADGNLMPYEIDTWNASGESLIWVNVASLSRGARFYMYFDGTPSAANISTSTWNSNYVGVWHLNETGFVSTMADSTSHQLNGTVTSSRGEYNDTPAAPIGNARWASHGGVKSYTTIPSYDSYNVGNTFTVSGWFKMDAASGYPRLFSRKDYYADKNGWEIEMYNGTANKFDVRGAAQDSFTEQVFPVSLLNGWAHVAFVYNGTTVTAYQNGVQVASGTITAATDNNKEMGICCDSDGNETAFTGAYDECRLLDAVASADWVKAEYQQSAKPEFLVAGTVETHVASTYAVSWTGGENATVAATVDSTPIKTGDSVEDGKSVVFMVTPSSGYTYAGVSATDWTLTDDVLSRTYTVSGGALEVTIPNAVAIPTVAKPVISPTTQSFSAAFNATITCATDGATIHYTTDESDPTESSPTYSSAISISATTTVKAKAFKTGCTASEVATAVYTYEAPQSTDPAISGFTATPNGSAVQFSLTGIELGSETGVAATSYSVAYEVRNSSEERVTSGTQFSGLTSSSCSFDVTELADGTYTGYVTITTDQNKTATKSAVFMIDTSSEEPTLPLGWTGARLTADSSGLRTDKYLIFAYAKGDYQVGSVPFTAAFKNKEYVDFSDQNFEMHVNGNSQHAAPEGAEDGGYSALLSNGIWYNDGDVSMTLKNLTVGRQYLVQIFCYRSAYNTGHVTVVGETLQGESYITSGAEGFDYGGTIIGVFTADAMTKTITIKSTSQWCFNGIQLRDVTPARTLQPGASAAETRKTIQDEIDAVAPYHGTVTLGNGTFEIDAQLFVTNGVTLVGQGWENTTLKYVGVADTADSRVAMIKEGAVLSHVTVTGGKLKGGNWTSGGGVQVRGSGTVSWCCVTNNYAKMGHGGGICGWGDKPAGNIKIDHTIVAFNKASENYGLQGGGIGFHTEASCPFDNIEIDTCLVYSNMVGAVNNTFDDRGGGGISFRGGQWNLAVVRNTTITDNMAYGKGGGLYTEGNLALVNNIIAGNEATVIDGSTKFMDIAFAYARLVDPTSANTHNCLFGLESEMIGEGSVFGDPNFVGNGDYHLGDASVAFGSGTSYDGSEGNVDLDNKPFAAPPSIGCYEYAGSGLEPEDTPAETRQMIQDAIDAVAPVHGTVFLGEDTFEIDQQLFVTNGVTLAGKGWEKTIIKQTSQSGLYGTYNRCATVSGGSTLANMTLTGGYMNGNQKGAGVLVEDGTVSWCCVTNNSNAGGNGGGIGIGYSEGSAKVRIDHTIVANNTSTVNGGGIGVAPSLNSTKGWYLTLEIDTCLVTGNKADGVGAGICVINKATPDAANDIVLINADIRNTTVAGNQGTGASSLGGGLYTTQKNTTLVNCIFTDNTIGGTGDPNVAFGNSVDSDVAANTGCCFFGTGSTAFGALAKTGDVKFVSGDYRLAADSPAIAAGSTQAGSDVDLDKVAFAAPPAIGCYEYASSVAAPKFTPASGTKFDTQLEVRINGQGTVYYTTDGSVPTTESSVYSSAITISDTTQFKARGYADGVLGAVASATYVKADADAGDYYVSTEGSDFADGLTPATAFRTIEHAVEVANDGQKVTILPGTFEIDETIVIDKAITVTGSGWGKTTIQPTSGTKIRLFELDNGAKLEGVTLTGGNVSSGDGGGAAAWVKNGTISWCCITNNVLGIQNAAGTAVSFSGGQGTIDHCFVTGNKSSGLYIKGSIGADGQAGPVIIDTCLVCGNTAWNGGGVGFQNMGSNDVTIRNCTITGNGGSGYSPGITFITGSGTYKVVNSIIAGNKTGDNEKNAYISADVTNQVSAEYSFFGLQSDIPASATHCSYGKVQFTNATDGDYHPSAGWEDVIGKGATYTGIGDTLDGIPFGNPPSIGCYEASYGFGKVTVSYPAKHEGEATVQIVGMSEGATSADVWFQYGPDADHLCDRIQVADDVGVGTDIVATMTGLDANMEYCYRFTATENDGTDPKSFTRDGTFKTTDWDVLQFSTVKANPYSTGAEAKVTIMKLGLGAKRADVYVQWGADENSLCPSVRISTTAVETQTLAYQITGLSPTNTYLVRFTGTNDVGDVAMREVRFTTTDVEHLKLSDAKVRNVGQASANISVTVPTVGDGAETAAVTLKWVIDGQTTTNTATMSASAFRGTTLSQQISSLTANTRYYYEIEAVSDAEVPETAKVSGKFWTSDPSIQPSDYNNTYPTTPGDGKAVTYLADHAGDEKTLEPGSPYVVVDAGMYTYEYTSTVTTAGQVYHFRDEYDLQYNASARIGDKYYLFVSDAVDAAKSGDVIEVLRNNYAVEKTMKIENKNLTINGNGHVIKVATPFLDNAGFVVDNPSSVYVVFLCGNSSDVKLNNMTVMGGGQYIDNYKYFISAICVGKDAGTSVSREMGGSNGILEMDHVTITRSQGGLNVAAETKCYMNACNIVRNARGCGGGFYNRGLVVMENSSLSENRSLLAGGGGAACENQGALFMNNCVIMNNGSTEYGGAINMVGNTGGISGSSMHAYCYMMNMTMAGNFTCNANNVGGGIGFHQTIEDTYMLNCILCNNYWYDTKNGTIKDSDIKIDTGNAYFLYSVYGNIVSGTAKDTSTCEPASANGVFKAYLSDTRVYQQKNVTLCNIPGPNPSSAPNDVLARYAPLTEDGSDADWGNDGVYTYFDASEWRSWVNDGTPNHIKMSYKTFGGEMTALGNCAAADEDHLVTTYYESAFDPMISDREIGVVGASGFGTLRQMYTLKLTEKPVNGTVSENLTLNGISYDCGAEVTVIATPDAACTFLGWYDKTNALVSTKSVYSFVMDSDKWLGAKFSPPSKTHTFLRILCEQEDTGDKHEHQEFPITITATWLQKQFPQLCPDGIPQDEDKIRQVEALLNEPDHENGLNHVWQDYVLGAMDPGDHNGRIWIKAQQNSDSGMLTFKMNELQPTHNSCGFNVRYRLADKNVKNNDAEYDRSREYWLKTDGSFDEPVTSDELEYRIIDLIFIPTGYVSSCEYVTTVNTAGVLKVDSNKKVEIISSPWVGFTPNANEQLDIKASDYVKSSCLSENDVVYIYDRAHSNYLAWAVKEGIWQQLDTYQIINGVVYKDSSAVDSSNTNSLPRGLGAWLERSNTKAPIYLYGQVDPSPVSTTLEAGFNLVGNPYPFTYDVSQLPPGEDKNGTKRTGMDGDHIVIPTGGTPINSTYDPQKGEWGWKTNMVKTIVIGGKTITGVSPTWTTEGLTLPIGLGFWYDNRSTETIRLDWPVNEND